MNPDPKKKMAMQNRVSSFQNENDSDGADESSDFDVINNLVADASSKYSEEGGSLKQCFLDLAKAITEAAQKVGGKDDSEDY